MRLNACGLDWIGFGFSNCGKRAITNAYNTISFIVVSFALVLFKKKKKIVVVAVIFCIVQASYVGLCQCVHELYA